MKIRALEISEANSYIKKVLSNDPILYNLKVRGEISNFKINSSGHVYLTLKDETSRMKCVIFKGNYDKSLQLEDGMKIIASGYISVYERDGAYQLYIQSIEKDGVGNLYIEFEKLKKKLNQEGLFDPRYKKKIPYMPKSIGVVTSETGAVIRDIINVVRRRFPKINVFLYPVAVQGANSADEIVKGIEFFNKMQNVDTLIVGRGGGSLEELWSFNEEKVARAIFNSDIPIISAVGHEVDYTICDFVSDMRAPTPSAAAELAVPDLNEVLYRLDNCKNRLKKNMSTVIDRDRNKSDNTFNSICTVVKNDIINMGKNNLKLMSNKLNRGIESKIEREKYQLENNFSSICSIVKNEVIKDGKNQLDVIAGRMENSISSKIDFEKYRLNIASENIGSSMNQIMINKRENMKNTGALLHSLSPLATIDRGYCMVQKEGKTVNSTEDIKVGEILNIRMSDGNADCTVNSIEKK